MSSFPRALGGACIGIRPKILKTLNCTPTAEALVGSSSADTELKNGVVSWFFARSLRDAHLRQQVNSRAGEEGPLNTPPAARLPASIV